jgi:hypothetical protein
MHGSLRDFLTTKGMLRIVADELGKLSTFFLHQERCTHHRFLDFSRHTARRAFAGNPAQAILRLAVHGVLQSALRREWRGRQCHLAHRNIGRNRVGMKMALQPSTKQPSFFFTRR